jgi:hypothetical protein
VTQSAPSNPFKFLDHYQETDEEKFAGRSADLQETLAIVARGRTSILYGGSGLGKTSLLLAAVVPALRSRGYDPIYLRLLDSPLAELCACVAKDLKEERIAPDDLPKMLEAPKRPVALIFDQFEEIFVRSRDRPQARPELAELFSLLSRVVHREGTSVRVMFSLREDYYGELLGLAGALEPGEIPSFRLSPLTAYGARQAIVRPLTVAKVAYEEPIVRLLVDEVAKYDFDPIILQILCTEVYREAAAREERPVRVTTADFEKSGGAVGVFRHYIESVDSSVTGDRSILVRAVLDALITSERTKRTVSVRELAQLAEPYGDTDASLVAGRAPSRLSFRASPTEIRDILELFRDKRLVRRLESRSGSNGEYRYELLHDRLVVIVREWLSLDDVFIRFRFAKSFIANLSEVGTWRSGPIAPLSHEQLRDLLDPWKDRLGLNVREAEFVLRSSVKERTESVTDWARLYDEMRSEGASQLVAGMFESPSPVLREGAAFAAGRIADS